MKKNATLYVHLESDPYELAF